MNKKIKFSLILAAAGILVTGAIAAPLITSCSESSDNGGGKKPPINPPNDENNKNPGGSDVNEPNKPTTTDKNLVLNLKPNIDLSSKVGFKSGKDNSTLAQKQINFQLGDKQSFVINLDSADNFFNLDLSNVKATDLFDNANDSFQLIWTTNTLEGKDDLLGLQSQNNVISNKNPVNEISQTVVLLKLTVIDNATNKSKNVSFNFIINKLTQNQPSQPILPPDLVTPPDDNNSSNDSPDGSQTNNGNLIINETKPSFEQTDSISNSDVKDKIYKTINCNEITGLSKDLSTAYKTLESSWYIQEHKDIFFGSESQNIGYISDVYLTIPSDVDSKIPNLLMTVSYRNNDNSKHCKLFSIKGFNDASFETNYDIYLTNLVNTIVSTNQNINNTNCLITKINKEKASINSNDILNANNNQIKNLLESSISSLNSTLIAEEFLEAPYNPSINEDRTLILTSKERQDLNSSSFELLIGNFIPNENDLSDLLNLHKEIQSNKINELTIKFKDDTKKQKINIPYFFIFDNSSKIIDETNFASEFQKAINNVYDLIKNKIAEKNVDYERYGIVNTIDLYYDDSNLLTKSSITDQILDSKFIDNNSSSNDFEYKINNYLFKYSVLYLFANNYSFSSNLKSNLINFDISANNKLSVIYADNVIDTNIDLIKNEKIAVNLQTIVDKITEKINEKLNGITIELPNNFFKNDSSNSIENYIWNVISKDPSINPDGLKYFSTWIDSILNLNYYNNNAYFINNTLKIISDVNVDFELNKYNNPIMKISIVNKVNNSYYTDVISEQKMNINLKVQGFSDSGLSDKISVRSSEINVTNFINENYKQNSSIYHFFSSYSDRQSLINFIYQFKWILFENSQKLDAGMIEKASLKLVDNVDPKNPKLNLNVKIKNEPQDLNITICGFDDASLSTHFENYLTQLGDYLFELSAYSKIGDLYNKYVQNDIFNMDDFSKMNTDFVLGSQVFLSTNKSFKDMNQNDYLNLIENKIKSFGNNLTLDKLINAFNDGQIMGWGNNSSPDYSIILTPQEKQAINSKTLRFGVTSVNDLTSKVYNNYHFGSGLIDNLNINEGANLLSIGFKDNLYSSTTNWLVQENPKEISINEFIVYFASIFNNVLSSNNSILNSSIDIPKSLSFNEQIKWIDSQIYTCNLNGYNSRLYVYEIVLLSNFILHLYNYSLPANFDYYNLMFTINNNNQLVIKYKDSIEQPINLNVNLNGWNTISSNEYFKEFEASLSQLFNQNKIQLSKSKLELLKQEDTINNNNRDLKEHEYIIEQMFKVISSEAKLKIMSIYNSLKNVKDSYMFGEMCNPFIIAFNYNQAQNGNNFVKFQKDVKIGNKTFKVNITSKLWALNKNYYDSFYVTFTYNETTQKLNLKAKWNAMLIEQQIEINLPIELVD